MPPKQRAIARVASTHVLILSLQQIMDGFQPTNPIKAYSDIHTKAPLNIFPDFNEKGKQLNTEKNLLSLMAYYGLEIWNNTVTKRDGYSIASVELKTQEKREIFSMKVKSSCCLNGLSYTLVDGYIKVAASTLKKNPVLGWINSKSWDGVKRVQQVIESVVCSDEMDKQLKDTLLLKWMTSVYTAAARKDGDDFQLRGVIVLQGRQSMGKTSFLRNLCGSKHGGSYEWFGVGATFNAKNEEHIIKANRFWIMESAELESTTKFSIPTLKAYITNPVNTIRFKYAHEEFEIWSRTAYAGTVNQMEFLPDQTGNSRFGCISVVRFIAI